MNLLRATALLCCLTTAGCSFIAVKPVPDDYKQRTLFYEERASFDCTSSNDATTADAAAVVVGLVVAETAGLNSLGSRHPTGTWVALVALGVSAIAGASAVYGSAKTTECRRVKTALGLPIEEPVQPPLEAPTRHSGCISDAQCTGKTGRRCDLGVCRW